LTTAILTFQLAIARNVFKVWAVNTVWTFTFAVRIYRLLAIRTSELEVPLGNL